MRGCGSGGERGTRARGGGGAVAEGGVAGGGGMAVEGVPGGGAGAWAAVPVGVAAASVVVPPAAAVAREREAAEANVRASHHLCAVALPSSRGGEVFEASQVGGSLARRGPWRGRGRARCGGRATARAGGAFFQSARRSAHGAGEAGAARARREKGLLAAAAARERGYRSA